MSTCMTVSVPQPICLFEVRHSYIFSFAYRQGIFTMLMYSSKCLLSSSVLKPKTTAIPVPAGQAIGPPLDGWHWGKIESSLSGTEWSSHLHHEEDCDRHGLPYPAKEQEEVDRLTSLHDYCTETTTRFTSTDHWSPDHTSVATKK